MENLKYLEVIISLAMMLVGFGVLWGKHTSSVRAQSEKNAEQDSAIKDINNKIENREDLMRDHIDKKIGRLDQKLDAILLKVSN